MDSRPLILRIVFALIAMLPVVLLFGNSQNPPLSRTGAPGETTCAECHLGAPNTKGGGVAAQFDTLATYTPGLKQKVTITVTPGQSVHGGTGFQATARLSNNQTAGKLEAGPSRTSVGTLNGHEYVTQN